MVSGIMINLLKKRKNVIFLGIIILTYCYIIFRMLPVNEALTPVIGEMVGKLYSGEGVSGLRSGITLWGNNLDKADIVYINGAKDSQCQIIYNSENKIIVSIPEEVYIGKESFQIQVARQVGGIHILKSGKFEIQVSKCEAKAPVISLPHTATIRQKKEKQRLVLQAENMPENTRLYVNKAEVNAILDYNNNTIVIDITPDMYEENGCLELMPVVELSDNQFLYGNTLEIKVEAPNFKQYTHTYGLAGNTLIMHAGGAWEGFTYTNCLEAFQSNYEKGCRAFELDLMLTSDDVIVGRQDWNTVLFNKPLVAEDELLTEAYQRNNLPKTYKELCRMYQGRTPLTWTDIMDYLLSDDDLYIVTSTKYYNDQAVGYLFGKIVEEAKAHGAAEALGRVAVQVYNQDMYQKIMEIYPFKEVIYTLYQSPDSNEEVLDFIDNSNVRTITLARGSIRDNDTFFQELISRGCYIYVHTLNDTELAAQYLARGCSGVYTDFLTDEQLSELKLRAEEVKAGQAQDNGGGTNTALANEEFSFNKKYLLNYLTEINNDGYLVLMCVADDATGMIDDEINAALMRIGISPSFRNAFRQSYIGIVSGGKNIYEAFSDDILEYTYVEGENVFQLKSVGFNYSEMNSIIVNGEEQVQAYDRGLQMVVFNKKLGIVEDNIIFDLNETLGCTNYAPVF